VAGQAITPTEPDEEIEKGRVALWLDPADLDWLSRQCFCTDVTPEVEKDRCGRVRFRANAALHKAGLKRSPVEEE
jgi:hypothetical protein